MSGNPSSSSKSGKQNKRRRDKKKAAKGVDDNKDELSLHDIREQVKEKLEKAKDEKDMKLVGKCREQLWVLNDLIAGVSTDIDEEKFNEIAADILPKKEPEVIVTSSLSEPERKLKTLQKKKTQIDELKKKQENGETLQPNQLQKLEKECELIEEMADLEELIKTLNIR